MHGGDDRQAGVPPLQRRPVRLVDAGRVRRRRRAGHRQKDLDHGLVNQPDALRVRQQDHVQGGGADKELLAAAANDSE